MKVLVGSIGGYLIYLKISNVEKTRMNSCAINISKDVAFQVILSCCLKSATL